MSNLPITTESIGIMPTQELEELILNKCGIKAQAKRYDSRTLIYVGNINSCFEIMRRLRLECDYTVYAKAGKHFILQID